MNVFDKARKVIKPTDRIIVSSRDIKKIRSIPSQEPGYKPTGLWYGIGTSWIDWLQSEEPEWMKEKLYKIEINNSVMRIRTKKEFVDFSKKYGILPSYLTTRDPKHVDIDWPAVAKTYTGIEINPYQHSMRLAYSWYYTWDVASGCIWNVSAVKKWFRTTL